MELIANAMTDIIHINLAVAQDVLQALTGLVRHAELTKIVIEIIFGMLINNVVYIQELIVDKTKNLMVQIVGV